VKFSSPLLGFNNNVKHKGKVFHIQTEDSGVKHPHIMTHLFADGGRILKSKKTTYAEHLGDEDMAKTVRGMMKEQHKAMFIALRAGKFDEQVDPTGEFAKLDKHGNPKPEGEEQAASAAPVSAEAVSVAAPPQAAPQAAPPQAAAGPAAPAGGVPVPATLPEAASAEAVPMGERDTLLDPVELSAAPSAPSFTAPVDPPAERPPPPGRPLIPGTRSNAPPVNAPVRIGMGSLDASHRLSPTRPIMAKVDAPQADAEVARPPESSSAPVSSSPQTVPLSRPLAPDMPMTPAEHDDGGIELDLDALERAAREAQTPPVFKEIRDLPPPPAAVINAKKGRAPVGIESTSYRSVTPPHQTSYRSAPSASGHRPTSRPREDEPPPSARSRPTPQEGQPSPKRAPADRYAHSRPASIFGGDRPPEGASIFGEELISEKSLDEVILGYLAEDLEGPKK